MTGFTRRSFLQLASLSLVRPGHAQCVPGAFSTPHKLGRLVLGPSRESGVFDERSVDCPFVFHHGSCFWMTYVGFDGVGYQTGLAASTDLVNWKRQGCILKRDPTSPIAKYNVALNWI